MEITLLEQRRIEAQILKTVYDVLKEDYGEEKAKEALLKTIERSAVEAGRKMAEKENVKPGPRELAAIQPLWQKGGALETRVLKLDDNTFDYEVTRCAYCEMYRELGIEDLGFILSCSRDSGFVKGYAPDLLLIRKSTIMEGGDICHFHYYLETKK
ncbi:MAG: L-2-amino-thiazoline-4-carboxylic acid hydrolase [Deltaproteobacteria bacterium]|nr:L-2-amino-thiazoline-4-carboxylic acid hydrolase [Deltaproteobacteria bacterium]